MEKFSFESIDELEKKSGYHLEALDLSFGNTGPEEIKRLTESHLIEDLQRLDLSGLNLGDEIIMMLCQGFDFVSLTDLSLGRSKIGDEGVKTLIKNINKFPKLERINLRRNFIAKKGAQQILSCKFPTKIQYLDLDYNEEIPSEERILLLKKFGSALN